MLFHEVSWVPISFKTPSRMSLITSGGARRDLISDKDSVLIFPTADLASLIKGSTSDNSSSISAFLEKKLIIVELLSKLIGTGLDYI